MNPPHGAEARAWRLIAAADRQSRHRQWQQAFDDYLAAARLFDGLGMPEAASSARHAMAELAYRYLQRPRDALALLATTLSGRSMDTSAIVGERLELMGRALTEYSNQTELPRRAVIALLHAAAERFESDRAGMRELPRLAIYEGYVDYRSGIPDEAEREFNAAALECRKLRDSECFAQARMDIAAMAEDRQSYAAALGAYEDALNSLDVSRMPKIGADIHYDLARLEGRVGLFRRSAADQNSAMHLYAQLGRCDLVRLSASSLGEMLVHVGSVSDAIDYLDRAATLDCAHLLESANGATGNGDDARADGSAFREEFAGVAGGRVDFAACVHPTSVPETTPDGKIAVFQALLALGEIAKSDDELKVTEACQRAARRYSVDARTQVRLLNARGELELELQRVTAARET
ncbi:MAG: hypothetical protein ACREUG_16140, partial [Steroidobacteraceae bacterium]